MSVLKPLVSDGQLNRQVQAGDCLGGAEVITVINNNAGQVIPAASMLTGLISRTGAPGAGYADTWDSAQNLIAALIANYPYVASNVGLSSGAAVPNGLSFRLKVLNAIAFANTTVTGTGVTLTNGIINASSTKEFLIQVTCGMPTQVFAANQTNASAVITGLNQFQTSQLAVGQLVTGTNIPAATTIISIQVGVGVTLSANATATLALNALTFGPTASITGLGQGLN